MGLISPAGVPALRSAYRARCAGRTLVSNTTLESSEERRPQRCLCSYTNYFGTSRRGKDRPRAKRRRATPPMRRNTHFAGPRRSTLMSRAFFIAWAKSEAACNCIHTHAPPPKALSRRIAISGEIPARPLIMSDNCL